MYPEIKVIEEPKGGANEGREQQLLFEHFEEYMMLDGRLELPFHIPNGGKRSGRSGAMMKLQGAKKGVPDILVPIKNEDYGGLFIEMKVHYKKGKNKVQEHQEKWLQQLFDQNFDCIVAYSAIAAFNYVVDYLANTKEGTKLYHLKAGHV